MMRDDDDIVEYDDPVNEYLYSPTVKNIKNLLSYWWSIIDGSTEVTPQIAFAQMATDFLSAPGKFVFALCLMLTKASVMTSTTGEQSFSTSGHMVSKFRHNLSDKSIHAATVFLAWNNHGLIPTDKILENIRSKGPRWREESVQQEDGNSV